MDIVVLGLVIGMANALLAVGLVLIYKANRVINLAHGELGAFAVAVMLALVRNTNMNYWLALLISLACTGVLAAMIERTVLRRLFRSPRLIMMIATIGVAQLIIVTRLLIPKPQTSFGDDIVAGGGGAFPVPFTIEPIHFGRIVLGSGHVIALIAGPIVAAAVFAFLRWSAYGVALRAAAENAQRARLLGVPVRRVSTLAWVVAGLLSALASILLAPVIGFSATEAVGLPILMRGLAAATVAGMSSVAVAFAVGLGIGVADQVVFFATNRAGLTDVILFAVVLVTLLVRRRSRGRAGEVDGSSWEAAEPVRPLPIEIARHPRWRVTRVALAASGLVALALIPVWMGPSGTFYLSTAILMAGVAVSMTVLTGWAGQMSLGQWAIAGVGGVLGSQLITEMHQPFWLAFVLAAIAGGLVATAIGLPALRLEGSALAVVTLGFAVVASSWLFDQPWFAGSGFIVRPAYLTHAVYYLIAIAFLAGIVLAARALHGSRVGRAIIASRDNPAQAMSFGVDVVRAKLTAFAISGVIAGAAGFLWSAGVGLADPTVFPAIRSLSIVAAVVLGGLGSIAGAILGTMYLRLIPYFGVEVVPHIDLLTTGVGLLLLLIFLPGGLARAMFGARDLLARALTGIDPRPRVQPASELSAAAVPVPAAAAARPAEADA